MAYNNRGTSDILKGSQTTGDGRYLLSMDDVAEIVAGVVERLRQSDDDDAGEASMAQDSAARVTRAADREGRFPDGGRLRSDGFSDTGQQARRPAAAPPKRSDAERLKDFPDATRLN